MQELKRIWNKSSKQVSFKYSNVDEFYKLNKKLINNYRVGCDKIFDSCTHCGLKFTDSFALFCKRYGYKINEIIK